MNDVQGQAYVIVDCALGRFAGEQGNATRRGTVVLRNARKLWHVSNPEVAAHEGVSKSMPPLSPTVPQIILRGLKEHVILKCTPKAAESIASHPASRAPGVRA